MDSSLFLPLDGSRGEDIGVTLGEFLIIPLRVLSNPFFFLLCGIRDLIKRVILKWKLLGDSNIPSHFALSFVLMFYTEGYFPSSFVFASPILLDCWERRERGIN